MFRRSAVNIYYNFFPTLRRNVSKSWYEYISSKSPDDMLFMNYGYTELDPEVRRAKLNDEDALHRYSIQLYHHLATAVEWEGADALEIGSGRGGGSSYLSRYFKPNSMIGIDITKTALDFCRKHYPEQGGLSYMLGNAEALNFNDNSFDIVINVESSNCYPNIESFFSEVVRVLKPGGYFLYADIRKETEMNIWGEQMKNTGLELIQEENITANALKALELDNERKQKLINQYAPKLLRGFFKEFAGMKGSHYIYGSFERGEKLYLSFVYRKAIHLTRFN